MTMVACWNISLRLHSGPDFINEALPGFFLFMFPLRVPCPQAQETQHIHLIDLLHPPAVFHQLVVGGVDVFRQRQGSGAIGVIVCRISSASCVTGIVGKDSSTSVVWV